MKIKTIEIEGKDHDVIIRRTARGADVFQIAANDASRTEKRIAEIDRLTPREDIFRQATRVAGVVYGTDRRGRADATNSMIHDVLDQIQRVADC